MKYVKAIAFIVGVGILSGAICSALGLEEAPSLMVGIPLGVAAMLYANFRWKLVA